MHCIIKVGFQQLKGMKEHIGVLSLTRPLTNMKWKFVLISKIVK
jgi:hypothetical protein